MRTLPAVLLASALLAPFAAAAPKSPAAATARADADRTIEQAIAGCASPAECQARVVHLLFFGQPSPEVRDAAFNRIVADLGRARDALLDAYPRVAPKDQVTVFELFNAGWDTMPHGADYTFTKLTVDGLESGDAAVRRAATRLMARWPIQRIGHFAADAADEDPHLLLGALMAIELTQDPRLARWVVGKMPAMNRAQLDEARRVFYAMGPRAVPYLRDRLEDADPRVRANGVRALLVVATPENIPVLEAWRQANPKADAALAAEIDAVIAGLQSGTYDRAIPKRPELTFD